jgi:hypothetical protein
MLFKKLFNRFFKSQYALKEGHAIEFVFESGGIDNYKFVNEFNIPYGRAMAALDITKELEEKTDIKYHKLAYNTIIELLKQGNNVGAGIVAHNSLERMEHITNVDLMYKLASVLYLWKGENPYTYDYEFAEKKIKHWRKDKDIAGFFLKTPMSDYLPCFDGLKMNISEWTDDQRRILIQTLKNHLSMLSEKSKNKELNITLSSEITKLEALVMNS